MKFAKFGIPVWAGLVTTTIEQEIPRMVLEEDRDRTPRAGRRKLRRTDGVAGELLKTGSYYYLSPKIYFR